MTRSSGENARLRERIADLKRSAALDSTTSSRPPASDGLARKSATGSARGAARHVRQAQRRPAGPRRNHPWRSREPGPHRGSHSVRLRRLWRALSDADRHADPVRRQVFDVPEPSLSRSRHRGHRCLCACGAVTTAVFPNGVSAPVQYGPRITAWVTYLSHAPVHSREARRRGP